MAEAQLTLRRERVLAELPKPSERTPMGTQTEPQHDEETRRLIREAEASGVVRHPWPGPQILN